MIQHFALAEARRPPDLPERTRVMYPIGYYETVLEVSGGRVRRLAPEARG